MNSIYRQISEYIESQREPMLENLKDLIDLEGHATERDDVAKAMEFYCDLLRKAGITNIVKHEIAPDRAPLIVAVWGAERPGEPILFSSHFDTVHMKGSFSESGCWVENDRLHGPGAKDCKGGGIIALYILKALVHIGWDKRPIKMIMVSDEEETHTGNDADKIIIEESMGCMCAFNMEPGDMENRLVIGRKTRHLFHITVNGVTGHAGNAFEQARNPIVEAAYKIQEIAKLTDLSLGTTVALTVINAGRQASTIPGVCEFVADICFQKKSDMERIYREIERIVQHSYTPDTHSTYRVEAAKLPAYEKTPEMMKLLELVNDTAQEIGLIPFGTVHRGACSDAGNIAAAGVPVLDGCGITGDGGHTRAEYAIIESMYERAKLFAYTVTKLG